MLKKHLLPWFACSLLAAETYKVQYGDTLSKIAREHSTTVPALRSLNNLDSDIIVPGQTLELSNHYTSSPTQKTHSTPQSYSTQPRSTQQNTTSQTHVMASGETLFSVSKRYGVSVQELLQWNNIPDINDIAVGSRIQVSENGSQRTQAAPNQRQYTPTPQTASRPQGNAHYHTVRSGETIFSISKAYNINQYDLMSWNQISDPTTLSVGQKLALYGGQNSHTSSNFHYQENVYQQPYNNQSPHQPARETYNSYNTDETYNNTEAWVDETHHTQTKNSDGSVYVKFTPTDRKHVIGPRGKSKVRKP